MQLLSRLHTKLQNSIFILNQLSRALYNKYSSSQDFFYGKLINKFVYNESKPDVIELKDSNCLSEDEEYLKKMYYTSSQKNKMKDLT